MASDGQAPDILGHLTRVSDSIQAFFNSDLSNIAQETDRVVGGAVRSTVDQLNALLGVNIPRPGPFIIKTPATPPDRTLSFLERSHIWMVRNKALTAALLAFIGTGALGAFMMYNHATVTKRKRRAKKAKNGSRTETVVIAGVPGSAMVRSLAQDLERRGFIVYVVVTNDEEEKCVRQEGRLDIRSLYLYLGGDQDVVAFSEQFRRPARPFPGAATHQPHLAGLILVPDTEYPSGSLETLSPEVWSDAFNSRVLSTVSLTHSFFSLLVDQSARVLILSPNVVAPLTPALNGVESAVVGALDGFVGTLRRELKAFGSVQVVQLKLGSIEFGSLATNLHAPLNSPQPGARKSMQAKHAAGSSPKELHHAVFDALTLRSPWRTIRVGRGSLVYEIAGKFFPHMLTEWMLNAEKVKVARQPRGLLESQGWENVEESVLGK